MKISNPAAARTRAASGPTISKKIRRRDAPSSCAASSISAAASPSTYGHGKIGGGVGCDQGEACVESAGLLSHQVDRQNDHDRRQDACGQDGDQDSVAAKRRPPAVLGADRGEKRQQCKGGEEESYSRCTGKIGAAGESGCDESEHDGQSGYRVLKARERVDGKPAENHRQRRRCQSD